jgi:hypothetical protein
MGRHKMALETYVWDGIGHAAAGVTFSVLDYVTYQLTNPKAKRINDKEACVGSIDLILDNTDKSDGDVPANDAMEYAMNIKSIREYMSTAGYVKLDHPFLERMKFGIISIASHEKINNSSLRQKAWFTLGMEIGYDSLIGLGYYMNVMRQSPLSAFALNCYQIPCFYTGLLIGNQFKKIFNWFMTSRDERKLGRTIKNLIEQTPIIDIIIKYEPSPELKEQLGDSGFEFYSAKLTQTGDALYRRLKKVASSVQQITGNVMTVTKDAAQEIITYPERKRQQEEEDRQKRLKRFDEHVKGK